MSIYWCGNMHTTYYKYKISVCNTTGMLRSRFCKIQWIHIYIPSLIQQNESIIYFVQATALTIEDNPMNCIDMVPNLTAPAEWWERSEETDRAPADWTLIISSEQNDEHLWFPSTSNTFHFEKLFLFAFKHFYSQNKNIKPFTLFEKERTFCIIPNHLGLCFIISHWHSLRQPNWLECWIIQFPFTSPVLSAPSLSSHSFFSSPVFSFLSFLHFRHRNPCL